MLKKFWQSLALLVPALIPSWRFFSGVGPSPRIELARYAVPDEPAPNWTEFQPRPRHVTLRDMARRLIYNPGWNEQLFLVSCAERLMERPTVHSVEEIRARMAATLRGHQDDLRSLPFWQFRVVFICRRGNQFEREIGFVSDVYELVGGRGH